MEREWIIAKEPVSYPEALDFMEKRVAAIRDGAAPECVWLLEHPPLYTAGTSAKRDDLLDPDRFPIFNAGRGGQYTYHGPGQRIAYVMLDLKLRGSDIGTYIQNLEDWVIDALEDFGVKALKRKERVGLWVERGYGREDKIAAIGVRVRKWVTFHGIALNVDPNLDHYRGIVPCGIQEHGVTSLWDLGHTPTMEEVDSALMASWSRTFG
jgi:lipoyl(octanoyl) transferase